MSSVFTYKRKELYKNNRIIHMAFNNLIVSVLEDGDIIATLPEGYEPVNETWFPIIEGSTPSIMGIITVSTDGQLTYKGNTITNTWVIGVCTWIN